MARNTFLRIREVEFIAKASGKSTIFRGVKILRHPDVRWAVAEVEQDRNAFNCRQTDGGICNTVPGFLNGKNGKIPGQFLVYS